MNKSNEVLSDQKSESKGTHSCCGGSSHQHQVENSVDSVKGYQCPMKCEGDNTYKVSGSCPVCNMHLKPVN